MYFTYNGSNSNKILNFFTKERVKIAYKTNNNLIKYLNNKKDTVQID